MGVVAAVTSAVVGVVSTVQQMEAQDEAQEAQERAAAEQRKVQQEQRAGQAAQSAAERRQQIREERIKRARLLQASQNTGVGMSSGTLGSTGNLATQLGSNIGFNIGQKAAGERISEYSQNAADFLSSANSKISEANQWGSLQRLSMNIFDRVGGFNAFGTFGTQSPAPVSDATIKQVGL